MPLIAGASENVAIKKCICRFEKNCFDIGFAYRKLCCCVGQLVDVAL